MANEYKLSYTAVQIDEKLGKVDTIETNLTTLEQTVSEHESNAVGKNVEGETFTINSTSAVAQVGAEVFNDYSNNKAVGQYSHAEGRSTTAQGNNSHAEGISSIASGPESHAEGFKTKASGSCSHAEGQSTYASGVSAHAEGTGSLADGFAAHAEGDGTDAIGYASHAEGRYTIATGGAQHVEGKYNIPDGDEYGYKPLNMYVHIVGNGEDRNTRSNAHTLDWDGNAWFSGDVYVGSTSGVNRDEGSKKLVTEDMFTDVAYINIEDNEDVEVPESNNNGTDVILNGSNKAGSTASFYAPTSAGIEYQVLHSDGNGGTPYWAYPTMPLAHVSGNSSSTISLTNGTITDVPLDNDFNVSASFFTGSARFSSETAGAIKVPMTGIYMINVSGYFSATKPSTAAYGKRDLFVYNGATEIFDVSDMFYAPTSTSLTGTLKGSGMVLLNADDLIYMKARISGVTGSISPQNKSTYLELVYMGEVY